MKHVLLLLLMLCSAMGLVGQTKSMRFEQTTHDFGTIKKSAGPVTFTFKFRNVSAEKEAVTVVETQPLCACISATFDTMAIKHWEIGNVVVTYNPKKMPAGKFTNSIFIVSDLFEDNYQLFVTGTIIDDLPKDSTAVKLVTVEEIKGDEGYKKIYSMFLGFDVAFIDSNDTDLRKFVKEVAKQSKIGGASEIVIEASTSQVASKKYENKFQLAEQRSMEALRMLVALFRSEGIDDSKFKFVTKAFIDGPKVETEGSKEGYKTYEYVKFKMK